MNGYKAFYNGKDTDIYASTLWDAKQKAIAFFKVPKSKHGLVAVVLAEKDGKEVTHIADF
jgi:hypothetical protein